jgi:FSR family fosmidomycin resistance protein-like MFS transporter
MVFTISGLALLSIATQFWMILVGSFTCGYWFIDHPEASFLGSGERGLAQSIFS